MGKKTVLVVLGLILAANIAVLLLAASRPDTFRVERSASIGAPPLRIYPLIANLKNWAAWSPWEKLDPTMKRRFSGADQGEGAMYAWEGNRDIGAGEMKVTRTEPPNRIVIRLDFRAPFEAHNTAEFVLTPEGDTTKVSWAMYGPAPLYMRVIHLFLDMDALLGGQFETGLASLKTVVERQD